MQILFHIFVLQNKNHKSVNMKIELKNIRIIDHMSEETTCFDAKLYVDNKCVAYCKNDGRGGMTDYYPYPENIQLFKMAQTYIENQPDIIYIHDSFPELRVKSTVDSWIDKQIYDKQVNKLELKLIRDCKKYICFGDKSHYKMVGWKNYSITELIGTPVGNALIQKKVDELKERGETILNTNLIGINI